MDQPDRRAITAYSVDRRTRQGPGRRAVLHVLLGRVLRRLQAVVPLQYDQVRAAQLRVRFLLRGGAKAAYDARPARSCRAAYRTMQCSRDCTSTYSSRHRRTTNISAWRDAPPTIIANLGLQSANDGNG